MSEPQAVWWREPRWWAVGAGAVVIVSVVIGVATRGNGPSSSPSGSLYGTPVDVTTITATAPVAPPPSSEPRPTVEVGLDTVATAAPSVVAEVTSMTAVTGTAVEPGEVGGPALSVVVTLTNQGESAVDLRSTVVNIYYGEDATPALPFTEGSAAFPGELAPGKATSGTFVVRVPEDQRDAITVELDLSVDTAMVLFNGPVAG